MQQRAQAEDWEKRAVLAVGEGKDELAKRALVRKQELGEYVASYQDQWQAQRDSVEQLKGSLRDLTQKIEEAQRKKNILIARAKRAEAQQRIQSTLSTSRDTSAFEAFDRMAKKVDQIEAQADAEREINQIDTGDKALESEFKQLERGDTSADQLLEDLKKKMGQIEDKSSESASQGTSGG
ncbi:Membrane-associated protein VIPP1, chloroplastic [Geodia barretti]|uniref:Membrane-associated protein VIPP1, chloroplastic n=1 Tax=Geodia barretti TaxID=519541 RepID=A0AA35W720_GEOBA|nr:Membrane-associated protein VIPP1, chloroplastic [Geodia barretti]